MNRCRECMAELSPGAAHCPKCGRELGPPVVLPQPGPPPPDPAGDWRIAIIVAGVVGVLLVVFIIGLLANPSGKTEFAPLDQSNVVPAAPAPAAGLVAATAEQLATAYEENGLAARDKFENRPIRVTGTVLRIGSNEGIPTISLQSSLPILAAFADPEPLKALKSGQEVAITCEALGETAGVLSLRGCALTALRERAAPAPDPSPTPAPPPDKTPTARRGGPQ